MFRYHKGSNLFLNSHNTFNEVSKKGAYIKSSADHKTLSNMLSDSRVYREQNLQKLYSCAKLNQIKKASIMSKLSQIGNLDKMRNITNNNKFNNISNNLPKPRSYDNISDKSVVDVHNNTMDIKTFAQKHQQELLKKSKATEQETNTTKQTIIIDSPSGMANLLNNINEAEINEFKQHDQIAQKPTKVINSPQQLQNLLNTINSTQKKLDIKQNQQQQQISNNEQNTNNVVQQEYQYVINNQQLINKAQFIVDTIQVQIYANPQYNYYKLIQFVHKMYEQYGNNPMVLMIICKGFSQFNKKQMFKLPQDKIGDIIQYIITQIKKDK